MPPKHKPKNPHQAASGSSGRSADVPPAQQQPFPRSPPSPTTPTSPHQGDDSAATTALIPPHLVSRILHEFFSSSAAAAPRAGEKTRISNAAVSAVAEYTRTFVREAVHRAAQEKREGDVRRFGSSVDFPEVEVGDLERVGPQLVLDF